MSNKVQFFRKNNQKDHRNNSNNGPAIMMMPPHIRATFMPNPPIAYVQPPKLKDSDTVELLPIIKPQRNVISDDESDEEDRTFFSKKAKNMDGMAKFLKHFEKIFTHLKIPWNRQSFPGYRHGINKMV